MASWQDPPYFDGAERGARPCPKALTTLTNAIGQVGFFIALALVAKPVPGRSCTDPWR